MLQDPQKHRTSAALGPLLFAAACVATLAACGGSDSPAPAPQPAPAPAPGPAPAPAPGPAPAPAAAAAPDVYVGTFSSRFNATTPVGTGESQIDATVTYTLQSTTNGQRLYVGTGTATMKSKSTINGINCTWDTASGDLLPSSGLIVNPDNAGSLSKKYQMSVAGQAMSTQRCDGSQPVSGPLQVTHDIGPASQCDLPSYTDPSNLTGTWTCNLPNNGGTLTVNWSLKPKTP